MGPYDYLMFIFPFGVRLILSYVFYSDLTLDHGYFCFFWLAEGGGGEANGTHFFYFQLS